ncbi:MAG: hypothetical protein ACLVHY_01895 [Gemmiger sp.]
MANAIEQTTGMHFTLVHYSEHALDSDANPRLLLCGPEMGIRQGDLGLRHPPTSSLPVSCAGQCNQ